MVNQKSTFPSMATEGFGRGAEHVCAQYIIKGWDGCMRSGTNFMYLSLYTE